MTNRIHLILKKNTWPGALALLAFLFLVVGHGRVAALQGPPAPQPFSAGAAALTTPAWSIIVLSPVDPPQITIEKFIVGNAPGADWQFTGSPDIGGFTLAAGGNVSVTFSDLALDTYSITETDIGGWIPSVSCSPDGETGGGTVDVTLDDSQDVVTCTFTNTQCLAGTYDNGTACVAADPGYYVDTDGATEQLECWLGTYSSSSGAVECVAADPGHYAKQSPADGQVECDPGTYQPDTNGYFCYQAEEGHYVPNPGATQQTPCEPGEYQNEERQDFCQTAQPGTYTDSYASVWSTSCSLGTYQPNWGGTFCYNADPGSYVPISGSSQQYPCEAGTVQPDDSQSSCRDAYPGHYAPNSGMDYELPCDPGTYQDEHGQTECKPAPAGTYAPNSAMTAPLDCAPGYISQEGATECYQETGTVIIIKDANPADDTSFGFTTDIEEVGQISTQAIGGTFSLSDPTQNTITFSSVPAGSHLVTEDAAQGWTLDSIVCDDTDSTGDTGDRAAFVELAAGETVTCTFTNSLIPTTAGLTLIKETNPDGGTGYPFTLDPIVPTFVDEWGSNGTTGGQFAFPSHIAADEAGNIYVADYGRHRIQKFDNAGNFLMAWGWDVVAGNGDVDFEICTVAADCKAGLTGSGDGQLNAPDGIAVDGNGHVFVVESGNHRVQKFTVDGVFVAKWGGVGSGAAAIAGKFNDPEEVAVDGAGNVYVADNLNYRVQKFDNNGTFIRAWGRDVVAGNANTGFEICLPADTCKGGVQGSGGGHFYTVTGIAVDNDGNVYATEPYNRRVQKFTGDGTFIAAWGWDVKVGGGTGYEICLPADTCQIGIIGTGDGQFNFPTDVAVDAAGNVYVSDPINERIQKFTSDGVFLLKWGSSGDGPGEFSTPNGVTVDKAGNVFVSDSGNDRIQKFAPREWSWMTTRATPSPISPRARTWSANWYRTARN